MKIHVLATVRKEELLPAATLVFKTLRVGFPTAHVNVWINGGKYFNDIFEAGKVAGVKAFTEYTTVHHEWVANLIGDEQEPFWICDTDVVFWDSMEQFDFNGVPLAGRFIPKFFCNFANAITQPRLHTSLMRIDPVKVRELVNKYGEHFPDIYCCPRPSLSDLVSPRYIPNRNEQSLFYDTTSLLWNAIGGYSFSPKQLNCYDHLNSATLSDLVGPCYPHYRMRETHFAIFENPQLAKGSWKLQDEFYAKHAC